METLWTWLKWLAAVATAIVAVLYIQRSGKHTQRQQVLVEKAKKLEADKKASMNQAVSAQKKAQAAKARAEAANKEVEARIDEIRDTDKSMAERLDSYRKRRARRLRNSP